jgi:hypothetical protein
VVRSPGSARPSPFGRGSIMAVTAALTVALALGTPVVASGATFTPDTAASSGDHAHERLLDGERTTHGLPAHAVDPFLAYEARDGAVACPDGSGTMVGRAKDMATSNFFSHALHLCPSYGTAGCGSRSTAGATRSTRATTRACARPATTTGCSCSPGA